MYNSKITNHGDRFLTCIGFFPRHLRSVLQWSVWQVPPCFPAAPNWNISNHLIQLYLPVINVWQRIYPCHTCIKKHAQVKTQECALVNGINVIHIDIEVSQCLRYPRKRGRHDPCCEHNHKCIIISTNLLDNYHGPSNLYQNWP